MAESFSATRFYGRSFGYAPRSGMGVVDYSTAMAVTGIDPEGTNPVPVNPGEFADLYEMSKMIDTMRLAMDKVKGSLFSFPFDVSLGKSGNNVLTEDLKEAVIKAKWLPELKKMYDWLVLFGFCPYRLVKFRRDLNSTEYAQKTNPAAATATTSRSPGDKDGGKKKEKKAAAAATDDDESKGGGDEKKEKKEKGEEKQKETKPEKHRYIQVPSVKMGYTYVYMDADMNQKLLWVWNPAFLPNKFKQEKSEKGYADKEVRFVVKDMPDVDGSLTCPLINTLRKYGYIKDRRCAELASLKGYFNPVLFFQKEDKTKSLVKSPADELNANYANAFNLDMTSVDSHNRMRSTADPAMQAFLATGGRTAANGQIVLPDGRTASLNASGLGALAEAGVTSRPFTTSSFSSFSSSSSSYGKVVPPLGTQQGAEAGASMDFVPFDPGNMVEGYQNSNLKGTKAVSSMDPELTNPMSGEAFRVKRLMDGEKVVELKNNTDVLLDKTSASELEFRFARDVGFVIGYPVELITGALSSATGGGGGGGGGKKSSSSSTGGGSGGSSGGSGGGGGSSGTGSARAATGGSEALRDYAVEGMIAWKEFYDQQLEDMFLLCYAKALASSKVNLELQLDRDDWWVIKAVYKVKVSLVPTYPKASYAETVSFLEDGVIDEDEFLEMNRARQGLDVSVLKNPVFGKRAKEKLNARHDEKYKMKMATDNALKIQDNKNENELAKANISAASKRESAQSKAGGGKKRKKEGGGGKKDKGGGKKKKKE